MLRSQWRSRASTLAAYRLAQLHDAAHVAAESPVPMAAQCAPRSNGCLGRRAGWILSTQEDFLYGAASASIAGDAAAEVPAAAQDELSRQLVRSVAYLSEAYATQQQHGAARWPRVPPLAPPRAGSPAALCIERLRRPVAEQLDDLLGEVKKRLSPSATADNSVLEVGFSLLDQSYMPLVREQYHMMRRTIFPLGNFFYVSLDERTTQQLCELRLPVLVFHNEFDASHSNSTLARNIAFTKFQLPIEILRRGFTLLFFEMDIWFHRDMYPALELWHPSRRFDIVMPSHWAWAHKPNIGIYTVRPTPAALAAFEYLVGHTREYPDHFDQWAMIGVMANRPNVLKRPGARPPPVDFGMMNPYLVLCVTYALAYRQSVAVHVLTTTPLSSAISKMAVAREGGWWEDSSGYYGGLQPLWVQQRTHNRRQRARHLPEDDAVLSVHDLHAGDGVQRVLSDGHQQQQIADANAADARALGAEHLRAHGYDEHATLRLVAFEYTQDAVEDAHFERDVHVVHERVALLLTVALLTNRTAVLPQMIALRRHYHVLYSLAAKSVEHLGIEWRESSFLSNPRVKPRTLQSPTRIVVDRSRVGVGYYESRGVGDTDVARIRWRWYNMAARSALQGTQRPTVGEIVAYTRNKSRGDPAELASARAALPTSGGAQYTPDTLRAAQQFFAALFTDEVQRADLLLLRLTSGMYLGESAFSDWLRAVAAEIPSPLVLRNAQCHLQKVFALLMNTLRWCKRDRSFLQSHPPHEHLETASICDSQDLDQTNHANL